MPIIEARVGPLQPLSGLEAGSASLPDRFRTQSDGFWQGSDQL
ncbi:hypothetical protein [Streptomyces sp. T12]|nr:hypothetical protein [Streptomyces sp. T12]